MIEEKGNPIGTNGRPTNTYTPTGRILSGCLADADMDQRMEWMRMDETITHTIVQKGCPIACKGDRFVFSGRLFDVKGVEDLNSLGISTCYYVEERSDVV